MSLCGVQGGGPRSDAGHPPDHPLTHWVRCLKACDMGPVMIVYPENWWFGRVESEAAIDEIIDALEEGRPAEAYLMADGVRVPLCGIEKKW